MKCFNDWCWHKYGELAGFEIINGEICISRICSKCFKKEKMFEIDRIKEQKNAIARDLNKL